MSTILDVQYATNTDNLPTEEKIHQWLDFALGAYSHPFSICIRIVDSPESQSLNQQYRGKDSPTNVLSFCFEMPECIHQDVEILGDLVICAEVVETEARQQDKQIFEHWAHMIIHGTLHLLGFDHIKEGEAEEMEQLEKDLLNKLNIADPYDDN
jgi:probable rRNA maturation factor